MPTIVQIDDGTEAEFPDDMTPQEIEAVMQKQFAPEQTNSDNATRKAALPKPELESTFPYGALGTLNDVLIEPTANIPATLYNLPADVANFIAGREIIRPVRRGEPTIPEMLPSADEIAKTELKFPMSAENPFALFFPDAGAKAEEIGPAAGGIIKGVEDLVRGLSSPEVLMSAGAGGGTALSRAPAAAFAGQMIQHTPEAYQEFGRQTVEGTPAEAWRSGVGAVGSSAMIGHIAAKGVGANPIEFAPKPPTAEQIAIDQAASIRLGLPPRAVPEMLPELQRTRDLVDRAIQEATQKIQVPGQIPAIDLLKAQGNEIVPASRSPLQRNVAPGDTGATVNFEGVQVSPKPLRTASDVLLERDRLQRERSQEAQPPVQATQPPVVEAKPEPAAQSPVRENGGRTSIVLQDGTAIVGGRFHGETIQEAIRLGLATEEQLVNGTSAFTKPDGTSWNLQGKPVEVKQIRNLSQPEPVVSEVVKPAVEVKTETQKVKEPWEMTRAEAKSISDRIQKIRDEAESSHPTPKDSADRTSQLQLEKGKLDRLKNQFEQKQMPPQQLRDSIKSQQEKVDAIKKMIDDRKKRTEEIAKKSAEQTLKEFPDITEPRPDYPFVIGKGNYSDIVLGHEAAVRKAIREGKPVPESVLKEYPDIAKPQDLTTKLESLKFKDVTGENLHAFPNPKAITEIGKQLWNDSIDLAIAAVKAGKSIGEAVDSAIKHIKFNAQKYNEAELRANLESVLSQEMGAKPAVGEREVPAVDVGAKATERGTATETSGIQVPPGQKQRSYSARASVAESVPEVIQEQIKVDPRSSYTPQPKPVAVESVSKMTDGELFALNLESNKYVAGQVELHNRLIARGETRAALDVIQTASDKLTKMGQNIEQAKLLNALKPEQQALVIDDVLKREGKDPLTPKQIEEVIEAGKAEKEAKAKLDLAKDEWVKNPTKENAKIAENLLDIANQKALEVQKLANRHTPKKFWQIMKSTLQGNLITPMSHVANVFGNTTFLPFRAAKRTGEAWIDAAQNYIFGSRRTASVGPISGTAEAAKGLGRGLAKVPSILLHGTGSVIKGELKAGMNPIKAWINQFSKNPEMPTTKGKITLQDRVNLLIEGTIGMPAEMMLRGLGAGDAPFREAARARITASELRMAKVPKDQWSFAQRFPELFFDDVVLEKIASQTDYAVFQRRSATLSHLTRMLASKGNFLDFAAATVVPFKLTPWNIIGEIFSYNPLIAFGRAIEGGIKKDRAKVNESAAKMVIGATLTTAGYLLYEKGLLSPSLDSRDETMKERIASGKVMPPNHLNISALERMFDKKRKLEPVTDEDLAFRPGDKTVDIMRAGGLAGAFFYMSANVGRSLEKQPEVDNSELIQSIIMQSSLEQARYGMNQSFMAGVEGLLSAIKDGNSDSYVKQYLNTLTSVALPNTLTALNRAFRENKPDFTSPALRGKFANIVKNRIGQTVDLPFKRDLWGEPLKETPEGRNQIIYQLFDVTKGQQITDDPKALEIYRLWRSTEDSRAIPSPPKAVMTHAGKTYLLNPQQHERLQILVGKRRAEVVDRLLLNPNWHTLTTEKKIETLDRVYRNGSEYGKKMAWREFGEELEMKKPKAGFDMP